MKKTIKVINLLNMIANREKLPYKIKFEDKIYIYYEVYAGYYEEDRYGEAKYKFLNFKNEQYHTTLNAELEIIEEDNDPKEIEEIGFTLDDSANSYYDIALKYLLEQQEKLRIAVNYLLKKDKI